MTAIKNWFLEKNECKGFYGKEIWIIKETAKAALVNVNMGSFIDQMWIPKSCIINEWEKDTSNFGYHEYLSETYRKASDYEYAHQLTTKQLIEFLNKNGTSYMNRQEWNNR